MIPPGSEGVKAMFWEIGALAMVISFAVIPVGIFVGIFVWNVIREIINYIKWKRDPVKYATDWVNKHGGARLK